jgi:hypothetical protein
MARSLIQPPLYFEMSNDDETPGVVEITTGGPRGPLRGPLRQPLGGSQSSSS